MSVASVKDGICRYFGGAYDTATHTYRTPQFTVAGMAIGVVRRSWAKREDHSDYYLGAVGVPTGSQIIVHTADGDEKRVAVAGAVSGVKEVLHKIEMHCFLRSTAPYVEDAQDAQDAFIDAVRNHLHADRTCGTGGFEAGYGNGFEVGEGGAPWLKWVNDSMTMTTKDISKGYVAFEFEAREYVQA